MKAMTCAVAAAAIIVSGLVGVSAEDLPLPSTLRDAKTIYLVNSGVSARAIDNAVKALKKWPRWMIVADAAAADITITLSAQPTRIVTNYGIVLFGGNPNVPVNSSFLSITDQGGVVLYGAEFGQLNPEKELFKLRDRLEGKHK